eukprot:CAMPEP_0171061858 /NCGR_PEP_ID=MMETSP0766_2-20121228/4714_1 /TAXON_ID=439317 /ORGANISM="Gambierdiscus australes, Strain CAWD 149" /LENGTH=61 /DNA_ID=CAMNT_0011517601 /DNA_START=309 /DNA_END=494 /DNA_ORIENTATION=+
MTISATVAPAAAINAEGLMQGTSSCWMYAERFCAAAKASHFSFPTMSRAECFEKPRTATVG